MITIDKTKALAKKRVPTEKLHKSALLYVACSYIMLGVCDDLTETDLYQHEVKNLVKRLSAELEKQVARMYAGLGDGEEEQYMNLVRVVEGAASMMSTMTPHEVNTFSALIVSMKKGEVYQASSDKAMEGMINQKRVKPIK